MAASYRPDPGAQPVPPWSVAILAQRDLEVQIPINYITYPGVSISSACFSNFIYADNAAGRCFSNLLAMGFRRFEMDLFWDSTRRVWSLCPVQLLGTNSSTSSRSSTSSVVLPVSTNSPATSSASSTSTIARRQATSVTNSPSSISSVTSSAISSPAAAQSGSDTEGNNLVSVGKYSCSRTLNLDLFAGVLADFLKQSSTNLGARMTYLSFNLHAPLTNSGSPESLDSLELPKANEQLNAVLTSISDDLYTPTALRSDRQNLNSSWLQSQANSKPDLTYLATSLNSNRQLVAQNGWPNEGLIEFQKRLVVSIGTIDTELRDYNTSLDYDLYHRTTSVMENRPVSFNSSGSLSSGCFYNASSYTVSAVNNSWSTSTETPLSSLNSTNPSYLPSVSSLTSCGISPFLNKSLSRSSADANPALYQSFSYSSLWSWSFNEPRNVTSSDANAKRIRCAVLDLSLGGRWRIADCADQHLGACRVGSSPYEWRLSTNKGSYSSQDEACPNNSSFAVPRTGLENTYLVNAFVLAQSQNQEIAADSLIWLNFNSLDTSSCWVQGVKSTCPYGGGANQSSKRQVIIPIVAAVVVLLIAALLLFVKCAANRRNHKRGRKRKGKEDAGEYEGVPS